MTAALADADASSSVVPIGAAQPLPRDVELPPTRQAAYNAPHRDHDKSYQAKMWLGVGCALAATVAGLLYFVSSVVMRVADIISAHAGADLSFGFTGSLLITLTLLRFLAMLIGAGMVFGGLAVSFHTHSQVTQMSAEKGDLGKASLATSSPGIAAIVVGAIVILCALFSKGEYSYKAPEYGIFVPAESQGAVGGAVPKGFAALPQLPPASEVLGATGSKER